jgi:MYXO-CTERM domain-containing protein
LEQWTFLLKPEGLSVVMDPVAEGTHAGKVSITKNELWPNGLNRVEVQHLPDEQHTSEGSDIYYGYSFYLPEELTEDDHQILYWETNAKNTGNYQQMMQVAVMGTHMRFATQKPSFKVHWEADGLATAGIWHRLAIHIKFESDPQVGSVDLWFDGEQVVTGAKAQTYIGDPTFVQHGILRDTIDKVETLFMDDARCGTTLEDVLPEPSVGGGAAGGTAGIAGGGTAGTPATNGGSGAGSDPGGAPSMGGAGAANSGNAGGGLASGGAATAGMTSGATATSESGCACRAARNEPGGSLLLLLGLASLLGRKHQRDARRQRPCRASAASLL